MALADIIKTALDRMQYIAKTETVIGEPITAGEVTLIPVSRVSIGFAAGGAGKDEKLGNGAGTGGGIQVTPVAFIVVTGEKVQVQPLESTDPVLNKVLSMAPDIITNVSKYFTSRNKKDRKAKKDDGKKEDSAKE